MVEGRSLLRQGENKLVTLGSHWKCECCKGRIPQIIVKRCGLFIFTLLCEGSKLLFSVSLVYLSSPLSHSLCFLSSWGRKYSLFNSSKEPWATPQAQLSLVNRLKRRLKIGWMQLKLLPPWSLQAHFISYPWKYQVLKVQNLFEFSYGCALI